MGISKISDMTMSTDCLANNFPITLQITLEMCLSGVLRLFKLHAKRFNVFSLFSFEKKSAMHMGAAYAPKISAKCEETNTKKTKKKMKIQYT